MLGIFGFCINYLVSSRNQNSKTSPSQFTTRLWPARACAVLTSLIRNLDPARLACCAVALAAAVGTVRSFTSELGELHQHNTHRPAQRSVRTLTCFPIDSWTELSELWHEMAQ